MRFPQEVQENFTEFLLKNFPYLAIVLNFCNDAF